MSEALNLEFSTTFTVLPKHTNYMFPMIFGGAFFAELDMCAAQCVNRLLHGNKFANGAVTHKFEGTFHKPCYSGDLIFLTARITGGKEKSVVVNVTAQRERKCRSGRALVATATFVFVTVNTDGSDFDQTGELPYVKHGIVFSKKFSELKVGDRFRLDEVGNGGCSFRKSADDECVSLFGRHKIIPDTMVKRETS